MRRRHLTTLQAIFEHPTRANILWDDIVSLLHALGAEAYEREGSRVIFVLNGKRALFHRPHPRKETVKGAVESMRDFLTAAGVEP